MDVLGSFLDDAALACLIFFLHATELYCYLIMLY